MLELYHAEPMANSMKVILCLKEKQLAFTSHYINLLLFEQHKPEFLALNPNGQVPVLVHNGIALDQSTTINEYLEDAFPDIALRPADPMQTAVMRNWNKFIDEYFFAPVSMWGWHYMVRQVASAIPAGQFDKLLERIPLKEQRQKWKTVAAESFSQSDLDEARQKVELSLGKLEDMLEKGPWLMGEMYTLADVNTYSLGSACVRLFPDLVSKDKTPAILAWLERMNAREAVKQALGMPNHSQETIRRYQEGSISFD
jgi:glutathione S-transferase